MTPRFGRLFSSQVGDTIYRVQCLTPRVQCVECVGLRLTLSNGVQNTVHA